MRGKKLTYEYVYNFFKKEGYELLDTEYINANFFMKYICVCGNISQITFEGLRRGQRCRKCSTKKIADKKRLTFEYVKNFFEKENCVLIDTKYFNNHFLLNYICECGTKSKICFNSFQYGGRCKKCGYQKVAEKRKFSYEYVYNFFKKEGCELLEKEYRDASSVLKYRCSCGNISQINFANFKSGKRCKKCGIKKSAISKKYSYEEVYNFFKKNNCELIETTYVGSRSPMKYRCSCGNISKTSFHDFRNGSRCEKCAREKRQQTMLKRHGVPFFVSCKFSKESQNLFKSIYEKINNKYKSKTYFATLNREFATIYKNKCFQYDFVNSKLKKVIEYNGSVFHPKPHQKDDEIGWFAMDKTKTVKEARDYEKIKYEGVERLGYKILTVWDTELRNDFNLLLKKCVDFLMS